MVTVVRAIEALPVVTAFSLLAGSNLGAMFDFFFLSFLSGELST